MRKKYEGKTCPYCHTPIGPSDIIAVCGTCDMPHHLSCWQENMSCTTFGCTGRIKAVLQPEPGNAAPTVAAAQVAPVQPAPQAAPIAPVVPQSVPATPPAPPAPQPEAPAAAKSDRPVAQKFESLYQTDSISVQPGCPVVVNSLNLLRGSVTGEVFVRCTLQSVTEKPITAILVDVDCKDVWGKIVEGLKDYQFMDLKTSRGSLFGQTKPIALPCSDTRFVSLTIRKICYASGEIDECKPTAHQFPLPTSLADGLKSADLASEYIRQSGHKNAKTTPVSQNGFWRCCCGCLSMDNVDTCPVCGYERAAVFALLDHDKLEADMIAFRQAEEERIAREKAELEERLAREQAEREERIRQAEEAARIEKEKRDAERAALLKKKRKKRRTITAIISTIVVLCLLVFLVIPYTLFTVANNKLTAGEYDGAYKLFSMLYDFNGSAELAQETLYLKAEHLMETEEFDAAQQLYLSLGNYKDSSTLANEAMYQKGHWLIEQERYDEALTVFLSLGAYSDSANMAKEAKFLFENVENERQYKQGCALLEGGKYDDAKAIFTALGNYKDSADKVKECEYHDAEVLLAKGMYDEAAALFGSLGDFKDAPTRVKEAKYNKAIALLEEGNYTAAANILNTISDYSDAAERAKEANYKVASDLYAAKKYEEAAEYYKAAGNYKDAASMAKKCTYNQASDLLKSGKYDEAAALFESLGNYEDSQTQVKEAKYQAAAKELKNGKYESAAAKFSALGSYKDSADKVKEAKYKNAKDKANSGLYAEAYKIYKDLGSYSDSKTQLDNVVYNWVDAILQNGSKTQAETFRKAVTLTTDQQAKVYSKIISKINANTTFKYWDDYNNNTTKSAMAYSLLQTISSSYKDTNNLMKLFKYITDGSMYSESTFIRGNKNFLEKVWTYGFVQDYLKSDYAITYFLESYWYNSSGYYIEFYKASSGNSTSSQFNLPYVTKPTGTKYFDIEGMIYYWEAEDGTQLAKVFRFEIVDFNKIKVYCYKNGSTYTLTRS